MVTRACANCGAAASPTGKFCRRCGAALPEPAETASALQVSPAPQTARPTPGRATVAPPAAQAPQSVSTAPVAVEQALLFRAKQDDRAAIETMFRQFLPPGEEIAAAEYLGVYGFWGFGRDSFGVATDRRVAGMQIGGFGEVLYQDASLEYVNSMVLYQPSRSGLYITVGAVAIATLGIGLLFAPLIARGYYRRKKSGLVIVVREGVSVYVFIDRKRMLAANRFYREIARLRENRVRRVGLA